MSGKLTLGRQGIVTPGELEALNKKLSLAMVELLRREGPRGGNPFIWAFSASKEHCLTDTIPGAPPGGWDAATDGVRYYWPPETLRKLSPKSIAMLMGHETYHIVLRHLMRGSLGGRNPVVWNVAVDYVVNSLVMKQAEANEYSKGIWGKLEQELGVYYMPLRELLERLRGENKNPLPKAWAYACFHVGDKTADEIYHEIATELHEQRGSCPVHSPNGMKAGGGGEGDGKGEGKGDGKDESEGDGEGGKGESKGDGKDESGGGQSGNGQCTCGEGWLPMGSGDAHIPTDVDPQQLIHEILSAATVAKTMSRGDLPAGVEEILSELGQPKLNLKDMVRAATQARAYDRGRYNDWRRLRRREIARGTIVPRQYRHEPKWIAMLDTSGSMTNAMMTAGVSELRDLASIGGGVVVPCDASPKWDRATTITTELDLQRVAVVGRGGTVFTDFFRDLPRKMGPEWDLVVLISDGYADKVPRELAPPCEVIWVIMGAPGSGQTKQDFGRTVYLPI